MCVCMVQVEAFNIASAFFKFLYSIFAVKNAQAHIYRKKSKVLKIIVF